MYDLNFYETEHTELCFFWSKSSVCVLLHCMSSCLSVAIVVSNFLYFLLVLTYLTHQGILMQNLFMYELAYKLWLTEKRAVKQLTFYNP